MIPRGHRCVMSPLLVWAFAVGSVGCIGGEEGEPQGVLVDEPDADGAASQDTPSAVSKRDAGRGGSAEALTDARPSSEGRVAVDAVASPDGAEAAAGRTAESAVDAMLLPDGAGSVDGREAGPFAGCVPNLADRAVSKSFAVRASVEQLHITHSAPDTAFEVVSCNGTLVARGTSDAQGSLVLRTLPPGSDYTLRLASNARDFTDHLTVMSVAESQPSDAFYQNQVLQPGFGYLTTRDGTKLSVFVSLPGPVEKGPYPTVLNYSGYDPSQPGGTLEGTEASMCLLFPVLCNSPHDESALIANLMGYASVGVNIRGTGCSGGAYDYFETLQQLDGYDAIEIVARQSWVKHGKIGMTGLSYPGISQLFVAQTQPPHLAAIAPMSVIADTATSVLAPGGIFNDGFAFRWADKVMNGAKPFGKGWERDVVATETAAGGTSTCEENQLLHGQYVDAIEKAKSHPYYGDTVKPLDPTTFVQKIHVPVFLSGQWQDEQTGPHFAALLDRFTGLPMARFTMSNGVHPDGFAPQVLVEWKTFLDLYVAKVPPRVDPLLRLFGPQLLASAFVEALAFPATRFENVSLYEDALRTYELEPRVRVIFETGTDPSLQNPGAPKGAFESAFASWPIPGTEPLRLYCQPGGGLSYDLPSPQGGSSVFQHDAAAGQRTTLQSAVESSDEVWLPSPRYDYRPLVPGKAVAFLSEPLADDRTMIGHGSVDLWLKSTADDADLEVNLTEVRPDNQESYVQSGWLRASQRKLRADATTLRPTHTHTEEDVKPLPAGTWELVRVELMPFGHVFRRGSRIRVSVDTPGDSRAAWKFVLLEYPTPPKHSVAHQRDYPSSLVLPWVRESSVPAAFAKLPACQALRGQPCRAFVPSTNTEEP